MRKKKKPAKYKFYSNWLSEIYCIKLDGGFSRVALEAFDCIVTYERKFLFLGQKEKLDFLDDSERKEYKELLPKGKHTKGQPHM